MVAIQILFVFFLHTAIPTSSFNFIHVCHNTDTEFHAHACIIWKYLRILLLLHVQATLHSFSAATEYSPYRFNKFMLNVS